MTYRASSSCTRRAFVASSAAAVMTSALPARADSKTPVRFLLVGSSMMAGAFGLYMGQQLSRQGHEVERVTRSASGLSRPDFFNWPKVMKESCDAFRPDVTVVMFGANDAQSINRPGLDPRWIYWDDPRWTDLYGRRVSAFSDIATSWGRIVWVGLPIMRPSKLDRRLGRINRIYKAEMSHRRHGLFIDTRGVLADERGKYTDHLPVDGKRALLRANDGVHVTGKGAKLLLEHAMPQIVDFATTDLPPKHAHNDRSCTRIG
jgi:hypothetical protein